jgi:hypothetical protein
MKKLIYLLSITFLLLQSCSPSDNNESNSDSTNVVLLKKIVNSDGETIFSYNGTKLTKINFNWADREYANITYSGDLITKIETFNSNNVSQTRTEYFYSSNKLTEAKGYWNNKLVETSTLTYNSDGSITDLYLSNSGSSFTTSYKKYFDSVGNLIKQEYLSGSNNYTYDTKNSPYKNITGWNNLVPCLGTNFLRINNILSEKQFVSGSAKVFTDRVYVYQYNSKDFPTSQTTTINGSTSSTSTETYYY